jgi:murein DD-endopeptidase MepM/ murein hydrolase activator NlpD
MPCAWARNNFSPTALTFNTEPVLQELASFSQRHRLGLVAAAVFALTGFALTAVAVAPLVTDATPVIQRMISLTVEPLGIADQLSELATRGITLNRNDITRGTDTAETLLARLGVRDPAAALFLRTDGTARRLLAGRGGKMVQAAFDADGQLQTLVARYPSDKSEQLKTHFTRLTLARSGGRWVSSTATVSYGTQMRLASGTIRSTLFAATDESGLPDGVAGQLSEIFAADIDFHRQLRQGDTFSVVYEALTADDEPVAWSEGAGRVAAAEFVNGGKSYKAVWFAASDGRGGYYGVDGRSKRRAFLASPMEFSRITSGFAMRMHPLMQTWRQHNGVDYGAPKGTPVRAVGDGVVDFAGWRSGYGNVVEMQHGNSRSTLYAHLSRIDVRKGQRAEQGQRLGTVGSTGWATGPHLHFEFRVGGQHQDPLRVAKASETVPLDASARARFGDVVRSVQAKLEVAETLSSRRSRVE